MRNGIWIAVLLTLSVSASAQLVESAVTASMSIQTADSAGEVATIATGSEQRAVLTATRRLTERLASNQTLTATSAQLSVARELANSQSTLAIRRLARAARGRASAATVTTVLQRLQSEKADHLKVALCEGLDSLLEGASLPLTTRDQVLTQTRVILTSATSPSELVNAAAMATARLGATGFDQLMMVRDGQARRKLKDAFYLAIAHTLDDRAITILREAAADSAQPEGARIQAICSLGQLFAGRAEAGQPVQPAETAATVSLLKHLISSPPSDQFFAVTLRVISQIAAPTETPEIRGLVLEALRSGRPERQLAALSAIYARPDLQDDEVVTLVGPLASATGDETLRAEAEAILDAVQTTTE